MILMRILPAVLKELSKHVPAVLFQTVEWNELVSELPHISRRVIQRDGFDELFQAQKVLLDPYNIVLTHDHLRHEGDNKDKWTGEKMLTLYFAQLYSPDGIFLDLRPSHFTDERPIFKWHPSPFWTKFNEDFRQGVLKVYEGFYLENDETYFEGLEQIGLLKKEFDQAEKNELAALFRAHFGDSLHSEMKFNLEEFRDAMIRMSEFMLNKKVKISKDFLYLGIYLVTLYAGLEEVHDKLPVKQIYLDVRGRFKAKEIG